MFRISWLEYVPPLSTTVCNSPTVLDTALDSAEGPKSMLGLLQYILTLPAQEKHHAHTRHLNGLTRSTLKVDTVSTADKLDLRA